MINIDQWAWALLLIAIGCNSSQVQPMKDNLVPKRMLVNIIPEGTDSTIFLMSIEMDSFSRFNLGTKRHWLIESRLKFLNDSIFCYTNQAWKPILRIKELLSSGFLPYNTNQDSFKLTVIAKPLSNKSSLGRRFYLVISDLGFDESLLLATTQRFEVKAVAFGFWPMDERFDYLFYQGDMEELSRAAYIKYIDPAVGAKIK